MSASITSAVPAWNMQGISTGSNDEPNVRHNARPNSNVNAESNGKDTNKKWSKTNGASILNITHEGGSVALPPPVWIKESPCEFHGNQIFPLGSLKFGMGNGHEEKFHMGRVKIPMGFYFFHLGNWTLPWEVVTFHGKDDFLREFQVSTRWHGMSKSTMENVPYHGK